MAKWRTSEPPHDVTKFFNEVKSQILESGEVEVDVPVTSISLYELWQQYQDAFRRGSCMSIDYPGGIDKLREDAMKERRKSITTEKGVE